MGEQSIISKPINITLLGSFLATILDFLFKNDLNGLENLGTPFSSMMRYTLNSGGARQFS